jgi:hypothetical protein
MTRQPPRNSYAAMGFEAKFNIDHAYLLVKAPAGYSPYQFLSELFEQKLSDSEIGRRIGRTHQAVGKYRRMYEAIKTKGL